MLRTRQSVNILRNPDTIEDNRLRELDFGDWEGLTWKDVHQHHETEMQAWGLDWVNRAPPNGETFAAQQRRCVAWLNDMLTNKADKRRVVVASHAGSIRALLCHCLDWPLSRAMSFNVDPATVTELEMNRIDGSCLVRSINSNRFRVASDIVAQ
jgi:broad specificity phosphatase PhoE